MARATAGHHSLVHVSEADPRVGGGGMHDDDMRHVGRWGHCAWAEHSAASQDGKKQPGAVCVWGGFRGDNRAIWRLPVEGA